MPRRLVLVHGRSQEYRNSVKLKAEWVDALSRGMAKSGLTLPIPESDIRFPYYGQVLYDLVKDVPPDEAARVIVRGDDGDAEQQAFVQDLMHAVCERFAVGDDQVRAAAGDDVLEKGVLNWKWVRAISKALDSHVPGASGAAVAVFTNDVYEYLTNPGLRGVIDEGVRRAFDPQCESVVVSHSLGTVVAHNVLTTFGHVKGWTVPLHVTLGSPLAIRTIRQRLAPLRHPQCVHKWFNAMDPQDVVALYPLAPPRFNVSPAIENKTDVDNRSENQHAAVGYLDDPEVARRIHDALVG